MEKLLFGLGRQQRGGKENWNGSFILFCWYSSTQRAVLTSYLPSLQPTNSHCCSFPWILQTWEWSFWWLEEVAIMQGGCRKTPCTIHTWMVGYCILCYSNISMCGNHAFINVHKSRRLKWSGFPRIWSLRMLWISPQTSSRVRLNRFECVDQRWDEQP